MIAQLSQLLSGFMESRALLTGVELDIFAVTSTGRTASEIASRIKADPRATELLLNALTAMHLLKKKDGTFTATKTSTQHLTGEGRLATMAAVHQWQRWSLLTDRVRAGASVIEEPLEDRVRDYIIARSHNIVAPEQTWIDAFIAARHRAAAQKACLVVAAVDGSRVRRMLDIGGGSGAYAIAFAKANARLEADILDLVPALNLIQQKVQQAGLSDRVRVRPGSLRRGDLGRDYDLILLSSVCETLSEAENRDLVRRCYEATAPGGRIVIQGFLLEPDKTTPRHAALFSLNMLVNTRAGASYSVGEYSDWLCGAGYSDIKRLQLSGATDVLLAQRR